MQAPVKTSTLEIEEIAAQIHVLSKNIWWTWNPPAQELFERLSPRTWRLSQHNAVSVMQTLSEAELRAVLADRGTFDLARRITRDFSAYMNDKNTWASFHAPEFRNAPVAYFSAEFGLHESLPIYSGGLGILSGDHMKSASDLGLPCYGVGLFYRHGYFNQVINENGWQQEVYPTLEAHDLPLDPVLDETGEHIKVSLTLGKSEVKVRAYRVNVGRISLILLDTNLPENEEHWRDLTSRVYGGDQLTRIGQELVLGVAGIRMLDALGVKPGVYHLNEGHSAFLILELLRQRIEAGDTLEQAQRSVTEKVVFTTHTPVPAGHDRFSLDLIDHMMSAWSDKLRMPLPEFMRLGRVNPDDEEEQFTMTALALRHCRNANAVSELNGEVSREMWTELYRRPEMKGRPEIGHITNGVHVLGWTNSITYGFWQRTLGDQWIKHLKTMDFWEKVADGEHLDDAEIWALRTMLKRHMIEAVRDRMQPAQRPGFIAGIDSALNPDALTLGFSRRFATYKRAPLIFHNMERAAELFNNLQRPLQIVFSGKAHPRDDAGKSFIQQIFHLSRDRRFLGKVFFIEGYDIELARILLSGIDVLLNNPRRPLEASGTSGMKVTVHGGLNLGVLDGWWREGYDGKNGFAIGEDRSHADSAEADDLDALALYEVLENRMLPDYYTRDERNLPVAWIERIRRAMATLIPRYTTDRMVAEYTEKYYRRK